MNENVGLLSASLAVRESRKVLEFNGFNLDPRKMEESDLLEDVDHGAGSNPNLSTTPSIVFMEAPISRVQQPLSMRNLAGFGCLSKQALIQLIDSLDFTEIHLPQKFFASESIAETPALMEAVGSALAEVVGQSPPTTVSPPRQLLSSNTYDTLPQTPTPRRQHIPELQAEGEDDDTEHTFARLSLIEPRVIEYKGMNYLIFYRISQLTYIGSVRSYTTTSLVEDDGRFVPSPPPSKRKFLEEEAKKALRDPERSASGFMRSFTTVARADNDERFVPAPPQSKRNFFERAAKKETTYRDPYISRLNVATTPSCGLQYLDVRATFEPLERDGPFEATNVRSMAMYDTGAESCVVCDDVLGLSLRSGERMFVLACVE